MSASYFKSKTFKRIPPTARVPSSFHNAYLMMLLPFCYCGLSLPRNNKLRHTQICHMPNPIFAKRFSSCHCTHNTCTPTHNWYNSHYDTTVRSSKDMCEGASKQVTTVLTVAHKIDKRNYITQSDSPRICSPAIVSFIFFNFNLWSF